MVDYYNLSRDSVSDDDVAYEIVLPVSRMEPSLGDTFVRYVHDPFFNVRYYWNARGLEAFTRMFLWTHGYSVTPEGPFPIEYADKVARILEGRL